jgi:aspartate racemase
MGHVATSEYYRLLNERVNAQLGGNSFPEIAMRSVDFGFVEYCVRTQNWTAAASRLTERAQQVERAGADFLLIAANVPHRVAPHIAENIGIPLIDIVDVTADAARAAGIGTVGLLGTKPVMQPGFFRERFAASGVNIVTPDETDADLVSHSLLVELVHGAISDRTRTEYERIIDGMVRQGAQGLVLGCTDLGQVITPPDVPDLLLFDTASLHVDRAVELALDQRPLPPA